MRPAVRALAKAARGVGGALGLGKRRRFVERPLDLACWNLFDLGVVDRRLLGHLDVFTVNHNSRQSLLENDGSGGFRDVLSEVGLDQDRVFPGWADDVAVPPIRRRGLYLYRQTNTLIVRYVDGAGARPVSGSLKLASPVRPPAPSPFEVAVDHHPEGQEEGATVRFTAGAGGELRVAPELVGLPVSVSLHPDVKLDEVFVGPTMANPSSHDFVLKLQDRHGMAWADLNEDGRLDVFIARGGLRGRLDRYRGVVRDELFVERATGYEDEATRYAIEKGTCRSRQASWIDLGDDLGLHLFVSCQGSAPQMHRRDPSGRFVNVAGDLGLAGIRGDHFAWVDVDGDGSLELLSVDGPSLKVYRRSNSGLFSQDQVVMLRGERVRKLAIGDFEGGGYPTLFAPSPQGNTLLINDRGALRAVDPASVGLPRTGGVTANWVDYDNDGLLDLHVVPGGLFRQRPGGTFVATGLLDGVPSTVVDARVTWFDSNGNGARDVVLATVAKPKSEPGGFQWTGRFFRNDGSCGHWLEVDLVGPPDNPHAIGAVVEMVAGGRTSTQWVGCNEGSHFSQGHYRSYFGLGSHTHADSVTVRWPDGTVGVLRRPAVDERLTMRHDRDSIAGPT